MLRTRVIRSLSTTCSRGLHTARWDVPVLRDASIDTFREAFASAQPVLLPREAHAALPAIRKWFQLDGNNRTPVAKLNASYLVQFGDTVVPLEITEGDRFARIENSLSFFLSCVEASPSTRIYLAQASLANLPFALQNDLPTPELVLKAGKGDIYDASIWLGQAPTYTPLHRDPNPNLLVQLAGAKVVRLFKPDVGGAIFGRVQEKIGACASPTMRGEEMMAGAENDALEEEVWGDSSEHTEDCWEATLKGGGSTLHIPKGWWHSVKSVGSGMTGSVNWWFR